MTDGRHSARRAATGADPRRGNGHRDRVWDLVSAYGPDLATLCRAGTALMSGLGGLGLSAGPAGTVPAVRYFSDTTSSQLESAQLTLNEGPCRDVTATRDPVWAADLATGSWRQRWPWFTPAALDAGARAVFALPLHAGGVCHDGAVDLYRPLPGPLNSAERLAAATFTAAAVELLTLESHGLNLTRVFTQGWRDPRPAGAAEETEGCVVAPAVIPPDTDGVLLACWFGPAMLGPARDQIRALALAQGLRADQAHRFVLAVHEAVVNAVRHGGGHGQLLLWRRDGTLWCEISDHGPGMPVPEPSGADAGPEPAWPGPSGLRIISRACTSMDITSSPTGTRMLLGHRLDDPSPA
ncbi:ATP-binding protein [Actinoplanes sp. NPDC023801]|uniref:ATP-binding protein n=1 Tax=Actinoplanes sp. NPDC023801 TaxID=3154595 RepID=UPI0033C6D88F